MKTGIVKGIVAVLALTLVGGGCAVFRSPAADTTPVVRQKVTIAEFGEVFLYAPLYVAQDKGFFAKEGLDVTITPTGGDEKTFAALLSKDAQFGVADPTFVAISGEKGQPGKVVASILNGAPFWGVAKSGKVMNFTKPSDLKGYSVATFPAPSTAYTLQNKMFQSAGLAPNIKETAFGSLLATVAAGRADIALEIEPNVSTAVKNGDHVVYALADYYPDFALTGLTVLPDYLKQNPETVQKVVNGLHQGTKYIAENPSDAAALLVKRFPEIAPEIAESALRNMLKARVFASDNVVSKAGWGAAIKLRQEVGDLKGDAPYATYVETSYAIAASNK